MIQQVARHQKHCRLAAVRVSPSENEMDTFFQKISKGKERPAILKITMPYAQEYIPRLSDTRFPLPITELYNPKMLDSDYIQLLSECEKVFQELKI